MTAWRMRNVHLMCVLRAEGKLMRRLLSSHWPFGHEQLNILYVLRRDSGMLVVLE